MKKICLLFGVLLVLQYPTTGQNAVVSPVRMNILYAGLPNPIEIAVPGIATDKISATVDNGTITRTADGWQIIPVNVNPCVITIFAGNKKIDEKTFRVKPTPNPVAFFAQTSSGVISKENALRGDRLEARFVDFEWDIEYKIVSFTMVAKDGSEFFAKDNSLTNEMKSQVSGLTRGNSIIFKDIRAVRPVEK